jgi:allophanate hydrolase subunit 1
MENLFKESFNIDDTNILKGLDDVEKALLKLKADADALGAEFSDTFKGANDEVKGLASTLGAAAEQAAQANAKQAQSIQTVTKANQSWYQSLKQTIAGWISFGAETTKANTESAKLNTTLSDTTKKLDGISKARADIQKVIATQGGVVQAYQKQELANLDKLEKKYKDLAAAKNDTGSPTPAGAAPATPGASGGGGINQVVGAFSRLAGTAAVVIAFLSKFQAGMDFISRITTSVSAVVTVLVQRIVLLGSAVGDFFSGNFSKAGDDLAAAFSNLGGALVDAAVGAYELEQRIQDLRDITIEQSIFAAQQRVELEKLKSVIDDGTRSINARAAATEKAAVVEKNLAEQAQDRAEAGLRAAKDTLNTLGQTAANKKALAEAEGALSDAIVENAKVDIDLQKHRREFTKERLDLIERERKGLEDIAKAISAINVAIAPEDTLDAQLAKNLQATQKQLDDLEKSRVDALEKLNIIEREKRKEGIAITEADIQKRQDLGELEQKIKDRQLGALLDVITAAADKQIQLDNETRKAKEALAARDEAALEGHIKAIKDLKDGETAILEEQFNAFIVLLEKQADQQRANGENSGKTERLIAEKKFEFGKIINQKRLEAELEAQKALLEAEEAFLVTNSRLNTQADTDRLAAIKSNIELIKAQIDTLGVTDPKAKKKGIWSALGFDDEESKTRAQENIATIIDGIGQLAQARVDDAEAAVQAADDKVKAAEDALSKEEELAKQGLANNTNLRRLELAEAKKARDLALKEETKAKKAQILLDGAVQLSSLITTAANIFKGFSTIPILGQVLAVGAVAAMFASFAVAKAQALKSIPKLRKGEKVQGNTHETGGELRELEHNEQVVGAMEAAGQDVFFDRMRKGHYRGVDLAALAEARSDSRRDPLGESAPRIKALEERRAAANEAMHFRALANAYEASTEKIVSALKERPDIYPWKQGYKERRKTGSVTTTKTVQPSE